MFGGDFSPATVGDFHRLVPPAYAGPRHLDVPGQLFPLSSFEADVATHFFTKLAPSYDVRPHLAKITAPTLVIVGRYDWVCPPAGSGLHPFRECYRGTGNLTPIAGPVLSYVE